MRNSKRFQVRFWLSIRTFSRMKIGLPCLVGFSPFVTFPFAVLLVISCFSSLILTSVCLKLGPHFTCVSNQFPVEQHTMENSHGREIHYHLARALELHRWLPSFLWTIRWLGRSSSGSLWTYQPGTSHARHLHTFVPIPSSSSVPTLVSHGGMPSHMVLNPEHNLRPLSIRREVNQLSDHRRQLPTPGRTHFFVQHTYTCLRNLPSYHYSWPWWRYFTSKVKIDNCGGLSSKEKTPINCHYNWILRFAGHLWYPARRVQLW